MIGVSRCAPTSPSRARPLAQASSTAKPGGWPGSTVESVEQAVIAVLGRAELYPLAERAADRLRARPQARPLRVRAVGGGARPLELLALPAACWRRCLHGRFGCRCSRCAAQAAGAAGRGAGAAAQTAELAREAISRAVRGRGGFSPLQLVRRRNATDLGCGGRAARRARRIDAKLAGGSGWAWSAELARPGGWRRITLRARERAALWPRLRLDPVLAPTSAYGICRAHAAGGFLFLCAT